MEILLQFELGTWIKGLEGLVCYFIKQSCKGATIWFTAVQEVASYQVYLR